MKIQICLFLVMSNLHLFAQKNTLELSTGYTRFGSWDVKGANINFSYQRKMNNWVNFYTQLNFSNGTLAKELGTDLYDDYPFAIFYAANQVQKLNLGPSIKVLGQKKHSFSFEPLISIVNYKFLATGGFIRNLSPNVPKESLYFGLPFNYEKGLALGLMGQIGYRFRLKKDFRIGVNSSIQTFDGNGETNISLVMSKSF